MGSVGGRERGRALVDAGDLCQKFGPLCYSRAYWLMGLSLCDKPIWVE